MAIPLCSPIAGQRPHRHYPSAGSQDRSRASGPIGTTDYFCSASPIAGQRPHRHYRLLLQRFTDRGPAAPPALQTTSAAF